MACSLPKIFGLRSWFEALFADLCEDHDALYVKRVWRTKWAADYMMSMRMAERGYVKLALLTFSYNTVFGTPYWLWKKYCTR